MAAFFFWLCRPCGVAIVLLLQSIRPICQKWKGEHTGRNTKMVQENAQMGGSGIPDTEGRRKANVKSGEGDEAAGSRASTST